MIPFKFHIIPFILLLSSCGSFVPEVSSQNQPSRNYSLPKNYAAHRNQQQILKVSGGKMAYTDHGTGPAIVLLHGVPTSSWLYRKIIPQLQTKHRVITIDLLGYGSSSKPKGGENTYSAKAQAERVQSLTKHLGVNSFNLAMHDMGGLVAWELMRKNPSSIENLIIFNTIVNQQGFNPPKMEPGLITKAMADSYSMNLTSGAALTITMGNLGLSKDHSLSEQECAGYVIPMKEGNGDAIYAFYTSLTPTLYSTLDDNASMFKKFKGRTLILWGGLDETLSTKQIPFLKKNLRIPKSNIHIYPTHNHFLQEEIPNAVSKEILSFLKAG